MVTRKNWEWWALSLGAAFLILPLLGKILLGVAVIAGYLISLRIHPFINCRTCNGTGRDTGGVFGYAHRQCTGCGGQTRHRRLGVVVLRSSGVTWAEQQAADARDNRRARPRP